MDTHLQTFVKVMNSHKLLNEPEIVPDLRAFRSKLPIPCHSSDRHSVSSHSKQLFTAGNFSARAFFLHPSVDVLVLKVLLIKLSARTL